jgi:hypothetical protein
LVFLRPSKIIISRRHTRRRALKIHGLDAATQLGALVDEIPKVLPRDLALAARLQGLLPLDAEVLDAALQTDAQVVGWEAEDFADRGGDACGVGVNVVDFFELGGDLGCETAGEGVWDLADDVGGCGDGCCELVYFEL